MFTVILVALLTVISVSLKISASGLELSSKVYARFSPKIRGKNKALKVVDGVVKVGLTTSILFMRLFAFIIARVRDLVSVVGAFAFLCGLVIILVVGSSVSGFLTLFANNQDMSELLNSDVVIEETVDLEQEEY